MAESLWNKARVAVLGKMNALMDKVANTPEAYAQRIRDLESGLADLRAADDEAVGTANGYKRQITELQSKKTSMQSDIDLLLGDNDPTNDDAALQMQVEMEGLDNQIATLQDLLSQTEENKAKLDSAVSQLEAKHQEMLNGLQRLQLASAATKAQNKASAAAEAAVQASDAASNASIDSIEARINHDKDVADARFERVIGNLQTNKSPEEVAKLARAKAALEARRAEIAGTAVKQTQAEAPAPAASTT